MEHSMLQNAIEKFVDCENVATVLEALSNVCEAKAKQSAAKNQKESITKGWLQAAHRIANVKVRV